MFTIIILATCISVLIEVHIEYLTNVSLLQYIYIYILTIFVFVRMSHLVMINVAMKLLHLIIKQVII